MNRVCARSIDPDRPVLGAALDEVCANARVLRPTAQNPLPTATSTQTPSTPTTT